MRMMCMIGFGVVACSGGAAPTPTQPTPVAEPTPEPSTQTSAPTADAAKPAAGTGHCAATEKAWFDCPVKGGKRVSLCGGPGAADAQYRFGPVGAPELVYPASAAGGKASFAIEERAHVRSQGTVAVFSNDGHKYEVSSYMGGGGGADAESNNFQGVYVYKGEKLIATVSCSASPTMQLDEWGG